MAEFVVSLRKSYKKLRKESNLIVFERHSDKARYAKYGRKGKKERALLSKSAHKQV